MRFDFRPLSREDVDALVAWHYEPPYHEYDPAYDPSDVREMQAAVGSATWFVIDDADGALAGFVVCRIGQDEVEVGLGLRPDLTGRGIGPPFIEAIVEVVRARWDPAHVTLDVLPWNERAIRAYERVGFARGELYERRFDDGKLNTFLRMQRRLR
ncbi:MAG: GNAT family N-acetyltransferase [Actinomycetota bacterium]